MPRAPEERRIHLAHLRQPRRFFGTSMNLAGVESICAYACQVCRVFQCRKLAEVSHLIEVRFQSSASKFYTYCTLLKPIVSSGAVSVVCMTLDSSARH